MTGDACLFHRLGGFRGGVSLDEPLLPASSLTRNTRNRLEQLAAIQTEKPEFARLVEARNNLCRQTELCRSLLENDQTLPEGQQRLDQVVHRREQLAAELHAHQLRLAAAGRKRSHSAIGLLLSLTPSSTSEVLRSTNLWNSWTRLPVWLRRRYSPPPPPKSVALGLTAVARSLSHHPRKAALTRSQPVVSPSTLVCPRLNH